MSAEDEVMSIPKFTPVVGIEAAIRSAYGGYLFGFVVTKVTASGQVVVKLRDGGEPHRPDGRRFDRHGYEMSSFSSKYNRDTVHFNVAELRAQAAHERRRRIAAIAICNVGVHPDVRHSLERGASEDRLRKELEILERLIAGARAAVDAISNPPIELTAAQTDATTVIVNPIEAR